jgi:hypothetical protein
MQKLVESKIDCSCTIYEELSHGYLNTDLVISEASKTIDDSIEQLKELMGPYLPQTEKKN